MIFDALIRLNFVENDPFFVENRSISHFFIQNDSKSGHISENRAILDEKMGKSDENFGGPKIPTKGLRFEFIQTSNEQKTSNLNKQNGITDN